MEMAKGPNQGAAGSAHIRFGVYNQPGSHVGKTVGEVRGSVGKLWGVPDDASAFLGKEKLDDNYIIQDGDNIEFHRRAGEKG